MKTLGISLLALCVIAGCSDTPKPIDTSGSHPSLGKTAAMTPEAKEAEVDTGRLVVSTPTSGYTVYTEDGHKVAHEQGPVERRLAPGRYFVRLYEKVPGRDFWVTVEKGRVTRVETPNGNGPPPTVR